MRLVGVLGGHCQLLEALKQSIWAARLQISATKCPFCGSNNCEAEDQWENQSRLPRVRVIRPAGRQRL